MDTYMRIRLYDGTAENAASVRGIIERLDSLLSAADEGSEVYALDHGAGLPVPVSEETFDVVSRALEFSASVGDAFEITIFPVSEAWGFTGEEHRIPSENELAELLALVGDDRISVDREHSAVLVPEGMAIDLGALAKGYAADLAAEKLVADGVENALLDLGSSTILALGHKPDGSKWKIAVQDPNDPSSYAGTLEISSGAVSTSGGCERYFVGDDGEIYWHILDPETGRPAKNGLLSVTVLSESAFLGDGLSTALFVMGIDGASEYWRANRSFDFIAIAEDRIYATAGAADVFAPAGSFADMPIQIVE